MRKLGIQKEVARYKKKNYGEKRKCKFPSTFIHLSTYINTCETLCIDNIIIFSYFYNLDISLLLYTLWYYNEKLKFADVVWEYHRDMILEKLNRFMQDIFYLNMTSTSIFHLFS